MFYDFEFAQILRRVIHFDALPGVVYLSFADKCQLCMIQFCYSLHNGKRMIESEKQQNVVAVCTPTGGFFDFLHTPVSNDRPPLLFVWQEATGSPNCLSGIEFPPHRTISILQGVLLVLSPNYHTVAIWLLNNCYYACRFKWEKYGTEHDYEWTNVVLNIIYSILARGTFKSTDILT